MDKQARKSVIISSKPQPPAFLFDCFLTLFNKIIGWKENTYAKSVLIKIRWKSVILSITLKKVIYEINW